MRELVPDFENLNSRGARVDGGRLLLYPRYLIKIMISGFFYNAGILKKFGALEPQHFLFWVRVLVDYYFATTFDKKY